MVRITYPATNQTGNGQAFTTFTYLYPGGPLLTTSVYDESGTLVSQVTESAGSEDETTGATGNVLPSSAKYDSQYRLNQLTDGKSHAFGQHFDNVGNLDKLSFPLGDFIQAQFDPDHNLTQRTNGRNQVTNLTLAPDDSRVTDTMSMPTPGIIPSMPLIRAGWTTMSSPMTRSPIQVALHCGPFIL